MKGALDTDPGGRQQSRGSGVESASDKAREKMGCKKNPETEQLEEEAGHPWALTPWRPPRWRGRFQNLQYTLERPESRVMAVQDGQLME